MLINRPRFNISLVHATARMPGGWIPAFRAWHDLAAQPEKVQYILGVHDSDLQRADPLPKNVFGQVSWVPQSGRYCSVDNWNAGVAASDALVIINVSDDFFPPPLWDEELMCLIGEAALLSERACVWVSTGSPRDRELMPISIVTRALYDSWGHLFWPEYESMYSDDDFTGRVTYDGGVGVISALDLMFEHRHPAFGKAPSDAVYAHQNRSGAYALGKEIFERRKASGFREKSQ